MNRRMLSTLATTCAIVLLPWQARWIVSTGTINSQPYEYGVMSVYASVIIAVIAAAMLVTERHVRLSVSRVAGLVLGIALLSVAFAPDPSLALWFVVSLCIVSSYFIIAKFSDETVVTRAVIAMGVLQAAIGMWQFGAQYVPASTLLGVAEHSPAVLGQSVVAFANGRLLRAYGLLPHPNIFGGIIAVAATFALAEFVKFAPGRTVMDRARTYLYGVTLLTLVMGLWVSFSRSAVISFAIVSFMTMVVVWRTNVIVRRRVGTVLTLCLLMFVMADVLAPGAWSSRMGLRTDLTAYALESRSIMERETALRESWSLVSIKSALVGTGPGNYVAALADRLKGRAVWLYQPVHSSPLVALFELGIIGFAALILLILSSLKSLVASFEWRFLAPVLVLICLAVFDHYLWTLVVGQALVLMVLGYAARRD